MANPNSRLLQIHNANETAFGVDEASFSARAIRTLTQPKFDAVQTAIDDPTIRTRIEEMYVKLLGLKNPTKLTFSTGLRGTSTAAGSAVQAKGAADLAEGQLLKNAFGGETLGTGTTVDDESATTTSFDVASAAGLAAGQAIAIAVGSPAALEANVIASVAGTTVTVVRAFSAAPANSAVVYAAATYYPVAPSGSLQLQAMGNEDAYFRFLGCQADLKFANLAAAQGGMINWELMAASWVKKTGAALTIPTFDNLVNPPIPGHASKLYIQDVGTTTRNVVDVSAIEIDPGLAPAQIPSVSGVEGVQAYAQGVPVPKLKLTINAHSGDYIDDWGTQQPYYLHYQIGATAGNVVLLELPNFTLDNVPERASVVNAHLGQALAGTGRGYGSTETDLCRAPIRLHLL